MTEIFLVDSNDPVRVDRYLRRLFPLATQTQIEKALRKKDILVNHQKATSAHRLQTGDELIVKPFWIHMIQQQPMDQKNISHERMNFSKEDADLIQSWILFDDDEFCVLNKASGIATQGGTHQHTSVDDMLKAYAHFYDPRVKFRLVHRLDKDTSGVLIIAKTLKYTQYLTQLFKENRLKKTYWAICHGKPDPTSGVINQPLLKKSRPDREGEMVFVDQKHGKKAETNYRLIKTLNHRLSWLELKPLTGRTHQIRVHLASIECPILNDFKYGPRDDQKKQSPLHLHARSIEFQSLDGNRFIFNAHPPQHLCDTLRQYQIDWEKYG